MIQVTPIRRSRRYLGIIFTALVMSYGIGCADDPSVNNCANSECADAGDSVDGSGDGGDTDGDTVEPTAVWGDVAQTCPTDDQTTPTPFSPVRAPESELGEPGIVWDAAPDCAPSDGGLGDPRGDFLYGVIPWDGEQHEALIQVNLSSTLDGAATSVSVFDAMTGETLGCVSFGTRGLVLSSAPLLLEETGTLYLTIHGTIPETAPDDSFTQNTGILAIELRSGATDLESATLFRHNWEFESTPGGGDARLKTDVTLTDHGLLGISNSGHFAALDAGTGAFFWDAIIPSNGGIASSPEKPFRTVQRETSTEFFAHDRCGDLISRTDAGRSAALPMPLGDYRVFQEGDSDERHVVALDSNGEQVVDFSCENPVALGSASIACISDGDTTWVKIADLQTGEVQWHALPIENDSRQKLRFGSRTVALEGHRVLLHGELFEQGRPAPSVLYVFDFETQELTRLARIDGGLGDVLRMSHRGVIYGQRKSDGYMLAIQTDEQLAATAWPFGLHSSDSPSGNDNRGLRVQRD